MSMEVIYNIIICLIVALVLVAFVVKFFTYSKDVQIAKAKEWLLWAVVEAEKHLGGGTGRLKLRYVYDLFIERFPFVAKVISFEKFSELVDNVLEDMEALLAGNTAVKNYVEGESK